MRGKNILLLAMLLSIAMAGTVFAQDWEPDATKVLVEPSVVTANPGETFTISIDIEKVTDLYGFEFKVQYRSGTRVIGALIAEDGGFLWGPQGTSFTYYIEKVKGYIHVGCSILGTWPGITGSGTLATVQFVVAEAGESVLNLEDVVLVDSSLNPMPTQTRDGYFDGANVELVRINVGARPKKVGDMATFEAKVINEGTVPLYTKARVDNIRAEDGWALTMYSNQTFAYPPIREPEYLYVDGFDYAVQEWTEVGAYPWLDAPEDGNYIEGTSNAAWHCWFSFEDIALEGAVIDYVQLEGFTNGPYDEGVDYDVYATGFNWLGSLYGTGSPEWITPRWVTGHSSDPDYYPALMTEEGINDCTVLVYFYDPGNVGGPGNIVDSLRLNVVFKAGRMPSEQYVDGFDYTLQEWTEVGAYPWLDAPEDGNYIEGTSNAAWHCWFSFEDIALGDAVVDYVQLEGFTNGPYDEGVDYDVYDAEFNWLGSLYGTGSPEWITPRWVGTDRTSDIVPALLTEEGINNLEVLLYFYDPGNVGGAGNKVDALRLVIYFKADRVNLPQVEDLYVIQPGQILTLDVAVWPLDTQDVGTYACTITVLYSYVGAFWNEGTKKVITESWWVSE